MYQRYLETVIFCHGKKQQGRSRMVTLRAFCTEPNTVWQTYDLPKTDRPTSYRDERSNLKAGRSAGEGESRESISRDRGQCKVVES